MKKGRNKCANRSHRNNTHNKQRTLAYQLADEFIFKTNYRQEIE